MVDQNAGAAADKDDVNHEASAQEDAESVNSDELGDDCDEFIPQTSTV